ncbi:hypothetical protein [Streptomyces sp. ITFR-6]|uniref:hypothetical protein n=1 Tax=Streptomyces sp. ITFR-6 TaxID=3075197 RepID=UPI00288BC974|nr:hypothetical protein [Streptomyces sp. ITFR-6]WNI28611.1 hypothetical protein RLT59_07295 [Streptomyces sp. ITFR-6]
MNVLTGPRSTVQQAAELRNLSQLLGLPLLHNSEDDLIDAETLYRAAGWDSCPLALADVDIADAYGLLIKDV